MSAGHFDLSDLFDSIHEERTRRAMTWKALSDEVGVSAATIRRFGSAADAEADGVLALIRWLDVPPEQFISDGAVSGERLPPAAGGYVRVDMHLVAQAAGAAGGSRGRSRTTIQRLAETAAVAGQTIASLVRLSEF